MPTTHVEPGSDALLQDIAGLLWKARKVVVITGAGISTNSGIPDFRSENGLYSLIQAQFDAARNQVSTTNSDVDAPEEPLDDRPTKRRRISRADPELPPQQSTDNGEGSCQQLEPAAEKEQEVGQGPPGHPSSATPSRIEVASTAESRQGIVTADPEPAVSSVEPQSAERLLPTLRPSVDPREQESTTPTPVAIGHSAATASSPPTMTLGTPRPRRLGDLRTWSSSPLSSPPPIMLDPYEDRLDDSPGSSSSEDSSSSRFRSEEPSSASTPLLASQPSFGSSSSRSSLPNMKGKDLFDAQIWSCPIKTSVFYTFATTLRQKVRSAEPTSSHQFVSVLRDSRKLVRCYTQNIDQLEERVGLSTSLALGAGSRYRFSTRPGRNAASSKVANKATEEPVAGSQGAAEQTTASQPSQPASQEDGTDTPPVATQSSQSGLEPEPTPNDTSAPTSNAPTATAPPPPPKRGVECVFLHGSLAELRCFVCARTASWDDEARLADTLAGRQPTCPHCAGATAAREERGKRALGVGKLRPDIVLYGEDHPHAHLISPIVQHDLSLGPDMLLILGTSMRVHGLKVLVREFAKAVHDRGGKVVFVNFTKPAESVWADIIDYWVQWDCDTWVGDLQKRKPALWLPPGTVLPEEEKQKSAKGSRRQSGEAGKRKDGAEKPAKKRKDEQVDFKAEINVLPLPEAQSPSEEMPPQLPPPPLTTSLKPAPKAVREPKLNPNAKRPASIRDHKQNGAYCVWKIMEDLRRITGGSPPPTIAPSSAAPARPKPKKPRKSAPAALESRNTLPNTDIPPEPLRGKPAGRAAPTILASPPAPEALPDEADIANADSIYAAVKNRRRKQAVTWRMIRGVETRVSLGGDPINDGVKQEVLPSPLPTTTALLQPSPVDIPRYKRLPEPIPSPQSQHPPPSPSSHSQIPHRYHHHHHHHHLPHHHTQHNPSTTNPNPSVSLSLSPPFRETDRLIAQATREASSSSRPATPPLPPLPHSLPLRLPPLNLSGLSAVPEHETDATKPKPAAMEPKVWSPGPRAEISSNVGSPVEGGRSGSWSGGYFVGNNPWNGGGGGGNAFFFADPGVEWSRFPPSWMRWQGVDERERWEWVEGGVRGEERLGPRLVQGLGQETRGSERISSSGAVVEGWCPDEQLRKEQEAALMLSAMRGAGV